MSRTVRNLVAIGSAMLLSVSLALPAFAGEPVPDASASGTGVSVQTSCNTAVAVQSAAAVSGPATVSGNGVAQSGDASVQLSGQQTQTNVQIGIGAAVGAVAIGAPVSVVADTTNAQQATNWAGMEQSAAAVTGAAATSGDTLNHSEFAQASSGDAEISANAGQHQTNIQASANVAAALGVLAFDEPIKVEASGLAAQTSKQTAMITQVAAATTGDATAAAPKSEDAVAESGEAEVNLHAFQDELTVQLIANIAVPILSADTSVKSTSVAAQSSQNALDIAQEGAGVTMSASANGADAMAETGEAELSLNQMQNAKAIQAAIMLNGTFLTW